MPDLRAWSEEELMAYADGELPPDLAAQLAAMLSQDAALARRVDAYRASRALLRNAFSQQQPRPLPQGLADLLREPAPPRRRRWATPLALAASLLLAVALLLRLVGTTGPTPLQVALETHASGEPLLAGTREYMPTASLRDAGDRWCRAYQVREAGATTQGLACREGDGRWVAQAEAASGAAHGSGNDQYHTASGNDAAPGASLPGARSLTATQEAEAIRQHWH